MLLKLCHLYLGLLLKVGELIGPKHFGASVDCRAGQVESLQGRLDIVYAPPVQILLDVHIEEALDGIFVCVHVLLL